jgi:hypothetical protein
MRIILIIAFISSVSFSASSQSVIRDAVTSGGAVLSNPSYNLSVSFGQLAIEHLSNSSLSFSQGFQQADLNSCFADFNNDGIRNTGDLNFLLGEFGCNVDCLTDLNGDGLVNTGDLNMFLVIYGSPCP